MLIRYEGKDKKNPSHGYLPWLASMVATNGFDMPKPWLMSRLACSEKMMQIIQQHVDYIRIQNPELTVAMLQPLFPHEGYWDTAAGILAGDLHASTYYNRAQVMQYLINTPTYTRQTKRVPLEEAFRGDLDGIRAYKSLDERLEKAAGKLEHDEFVKLKIAIANAKDELLDKYCPECTQTVLNKKHRTAVEAVEVQPFDWFTENKEKGRFISAARAQRSGVYRNTEMMYRDMFVSCATKITFGKNKTFFWIPADEEGFLVPMTF